MSRAHWRHLLTLLLAFAVMFGGIANAPSAVADGKTDATACAQKLKLSKPSATDAAAKTSVILVHGLWSDTDTWLEGQPSMRSVIEHMDGVQPYRFNYKSTNDDWVTSGDTAQRLAKTIVCLSRLYDGKRVVIVAHSMGGLLTRAALDWAAYGTFAKKVTGHVVTIGTPHTGAPISAFGSDLLTSRCNLAFVWWGQDAYDNCAIVIGDYAPAAMATGSKQLAALPKIPSGITVKAIAGEVKKLSCALWGCSVAYSTNGDLVVPVKSATAEYTTTGKGDGKTVFECEDPTALLQVSHPWCEHNEMLKSPRVQSEVRQSIQDYLAAEKERSAKPKGKPYEFFAAMTLYLEGDYSVRPLHGEGPSSYEVQCRERSACPQFDIYMPNEVGGELGWQDWGLPGCTSDDETKPSTTGIVRKADRKIGNKPAHYYEAELCGKGAPRQTARFWEATDGSIFIGSIDGNNRMWDQADAIIAGATWK